MNATDTFLGLATNEDGTAKYPNYFDYLPQINAAMDEQSRIAKARDKAGWDYDPEYGWGCDNPVTGESMTESEYVDAGFILPEDAVVPDTKSAEWRIYVAISGETSALINKYLETKDLGLLDKVINLSRVSTGILWGHI